MVSVFGSVGWLALSSLLAFLASLTFHKPTIFQGCSWMTYGHLQAASLNLFLYGFALQAGLGLLLWLVCRLGRTTLVWRELATLGAAAWNFGVLVGLLGIVAGNGTGFEWLEMPRSANGVLFAAYLFVALSAVLTFQARREPQLYVSQWFILAALFWFPWIFSTAVGLLQCAPVRGTMQAVVHFWYANNLGVIWLGFVGLAVIFYFLPKLTGRPLHSAYTAMTTFWLLALFGGWGGIPHGAPVPAWMPSLSAVATVLTIVPVLAVAYNCRQTLAGWRSKEPVSLPLRFIVVAVVSYVLAGLANAVSSVREVSEITYFTHFTTALSRLGLYGFFAMAVFGAVYHIVPQLTGVDWPSRKLAWAHFILATAGLVFFVVPLGIGGVLQGIKLHDVDGLRRHVEEVGFLNITEAALKFFRPSTFGDLLMLAGNVCLLLNLKLLVYRGCRACWARVAAGNAKANIAEEAA